MEALAAHTPTVAGIDVLVDVGFIEVDQVLAVPLRILQPRR